MTASRAATKLTPETHAMIVEAISKGRSVAHAADLARVRRATVYDWLNRGQDGIAPYVQFYQDTLAARAKGMVDLVDKIEDAADYSECPTCTCEKKCELRGDWKARAWVGERLYPELQITQKVEHHVQQSVENLLDRVQAHMSEEAYAQLVAAIARVRGLDAPQDGGAFESEAKRIGSGG